MDVLASRQVHHPAGGRHIFSLGSVHFQFPSFVHRIDDWLDGTAGDILHISDVGPVGEGIVLVGGRIDAAAHVGHLVAAIGNLVPVDDHVLSLIRGAVGDLDATVVLDGLAGGDGSQIFQFLGQFHRQGVSAVGNHPDVSIGEFPCFLHTAVDGGLLVQGPGKALFIQLPVAGDIPGIDLSVIQSG